jgi:hypothetical protein
MSTLPEIETAIYRLPLSEQEKLLNHLLIRVRHERSAAAPALLEQWMGRLEALRASIGSGSVTIPSEQILAEAREERN